MTVTFPVRAVMKLVARPVSIRPCSSDRLLAAVPVAHRKRAAAVLKSPCLGGRGLRAWVVLLDADDRPLPGGLPEELVEVYFDDSEAEPLHDCERCGLTVPVRAARRCGHEATVERVYFPACPHCGGRTGRHAYWSRTA